MRDIIEAIHLIIFMTLSPAEYPPPLEEMPLSVTSYWLFDEQLRPVEWGGQADEDPHHYANMVQTDPNHAGVVGACINDWIGTQNTIQVIFHWWGEPMSIHCYDAFGAVSYREPFYHDRHETWVIPIDILSPIPYYGLVYDWSTQWTPVVTSP